MASLQLFQISNTGLFFSSGLAFLISAAAGYFIGKKQRSLAYRKWLRPQMPARPFEENDGVQKIKQKIFEVLSGIPLDIEGSNLQNTGWFPELADIEFMGEEEFVRATEEAKSKDRAVLFNNVQLEWDACSCGDAGYGCSHPRYVYGMQILNSDKSHSVELEESELQFENGKRRLILPIQDATAYDFYRACELCGIELEFSDYAKQLITKAKEQ